MKGEDRETSPKNRTSIRTIQVPAPLIKVLTDHKERCEEIAGFSDDCKICGVFRALRDTSVENRNRRYSERAGIKKIRIHDFRHPYVKHTTKKYSRLYKGFKEVWNIILPPQKLTASVRSLFAISCLSRISTHKIKSKAHYGASAPSLHCVWQNNDGALFSFYYTCDPSKQRRFFRIRKFLNQYFINLAPGTPQMLHFSG